MKSLTKQKIGLVFALCACVLFWLPIHSGQRFVLFIPVGKEQLNLIPNLSSGLASLIIVFLIYIRGIISFKTKKTRLFSILTNWALLATFVEIFISPMGKSPNYDALTENIMLLIFAILFISILLFGVKEIAKIVLLIFIVGSFFSNILLVSESMGTLGFVALALIITSFYLQGNLNVKVLEIETRYLFANSRNQTIKLIDDAQKESKRALTKLL